MSIDIFSKLFKLRKAFRTKSFNHFQAVKSPKINFICLISKSEKSLTKNSVNCSKKGMKMNGFENIFEISDERWGYL